MPGLTSLGSKGPMTPKTVNYKRERAKLAHSSAQLEASAAEWSLSERFKSASHMSLPRLRTKFTAVKSTSTIDLIGDLAEHYVQRPDPVFSKPGDFIKNNEVNNHVHDPNAEKVQPMAQVSDDEMEERSRLHHAVDAVRSRTRSVKMTLRSISRGRRKPIPEDWVNLKPLGAGHDPDSLQRQLEPALELSPEVLLHVADDAPLCRSRSRNVTYTDVEENALGLVLVLGPEVQDSVPLPFSANGNGHRRIPSCPLSSFPALSGLAIHLPNVEPPLDIAHAPTLDAEVYGKEEGLTAAKDDTTKPEAKSECFLRRTVRKSFTRVRSMSRKAKACKPLPANFAPDFKGEEAKPQVEDAQVMIPTYLAPAPTADLGAEPLGPELEATSEPQAKSKPKQKQRSKQKEAKTGAGRWRNLSFGRMGSKSKAVINPTHNEGSVTVPRLRSKSSSRGANPFANKALPDAPPLPSWPACIVETEERRAREEAQEGEAQKEEAQREVEARGPEAIDKPEGVVREVALVSAEAPTPLASAAPVAAPAAECSHADDFAHSVDEHAIVSATEPELRANLEAPPTEPSATLDENSSPPLELPANPASVAISDPDSADISLTSVDLHAFLAEFSYIEADTPDLSGFDLLFEAALVNGDVESINVVSGDVDMGELGQLTKGFEGTPPLSMRRRAIAALQEQTLSKAPKKPQPQQFEPKAEIQCEDEDAMFRSSSRSWTPRAPLIGATGMDFTLGSNWNVASTPDATPTNPVGGPPLSRKPGDLPQCHSKPSASVSSQQFLIHPTAAAAAADDDDDKHSLDTETLLNDPKIAAQTWPQTKPEAHPEAKFYSVPTADISMVTHPGLRNEYHQTQTVSSPAALHVLRTLFMPERDKDAPNSDEPAANAKAKRFASNPFDGLPSPAPLSTLRVVTAPTPTTPTFDMPRPPPPAQLLDGPHYPSTFPLERIGERVFTPLAAVWKKMATDEAAHLAALYLQIETEVDAMGWGKEKREGHILDFFERQAKIVAPEVQKRNAYTILGALKDTEKLIRANPPFFQAVQLAADLKKTLEMFGAKRVREAEEMILARWPLDTEFQPNPNTEALSSRHTSNGNHYVGQLDHDTDLVVQLSLDNAAPSDNIESMPKPDEMAFLGGAGNGVRRALGDAVGLNANSATSSSMPSDVSRVSTGLASNAGRAESVRTTAWHERENMPPPKAWWADTYPQPAAASVLETAPRAPTLAKTKSKTRLVIATDFMSIFKTDKQGKNGKKEKQTKKKTKDAAAVEAMRAEMKIMADLAIEEALQAGPSSGSDSSTRTLRAFAPAQTTTRGGLGGLQVRLEIDKPLPAAPTYAPARFPHPISGRANALAVGPVQALQNADADIDATAVSRRSQLDAFPHHLGSEPETSPPKKDHKAKPIDNDEKKRCARSTESSRQKARKRSQPDLELQDGRQVIEARSNAASQQTSPLAPPLPATPQRSSPLPAVSLSPNSIKPYGQYSKHISRMSERSDYSHSTEYSPDCGTSHLLPDLSFQSVYAPPTFPAAGGPLARGDEWYRCNRDHVDELARGGALLQLSGMVDPRQGTVATESEAVEAEEEEEEEETEWAPEEWESSIQRRGGGGGGGSKDDDDENMFHTLSPQSVSSEDDMPSNSQPDLPWRAKIFRDNSQPSL